MWNNLVTITPNKSKKKILSLLFISLSFLLSPPFLPFSCILFDHFFPSIISFQTSLLSCFDHVSIYTSNNYANNNNTYGSLSQAIQDTGSSGSYFQPPPPPLSFDDGGHVAPPPPAFGDSHGSSSDYSYDPQQNLLPPIEDPNNNTSGEHYGGFEDRAMNDYKKMEFDDSQYDDAPAPPPPPPF